MNDDPRRDAARDGRARRGRAARRVAACLALAALAALACSDHEVPASLIGRWTSPDPRYAGRSLAISRATIEFGTGEITSQSFLIESVESEPAGGGATLHAVRYRDTDGSPVSVRLQVLASGGPALRFENHDELWVRDGGAPEPGRGDK